jgi:hypothetical protein
MISSSFSGPRVPARRASAGLPSEPHTAARRRRRRASGLVGAGLGALALLAGACGDDAAPARSVGPPVDAGLITCELGSENCVCMGGSGCQEGLICIAGRCLDTEEPSGTDAPPRDRPRPNGIDSNLPPDPDQPEQPDAAAPDAASPGGTPDASASGPDQPPPDAGDG